MCEFKVSRENLHVQKSVMSSKKNHLALNILHYQKRSLLLISLRLGMKDQENIYYMQYFYYSDLHAEQNILNKPITCAERSDAVEGTLLQAFLPSWKMILLSLVFSNLHHLTLIHRPNNSRGEGEGIRCPKMLGKRCTAIQVFTCCNNATQIGPPHAS